MEHKPQQTGLVSVTFRALSPWEIIRLVAEAGLAAIEWGGDVHVPPGDGAHARAVGEATRAAGLNVVSYGSYYRVGLSEGDGLPFERVLDTALALQAPVVRVWAGTVGSQNADSDTWREVVQEACCIAGLAAQADVMVAFEFHGGTLADTADATRRLLQEADHANLRTLWQPNVGDSVDVRLAALQQMRPWLAHVHVFHWQGHERRALAEGQDEWKQYLSLLPAGGNHPLLLEFVRDDSPATFREDAQTLLRLARGAGLS